MRRGLFRIALCMVVAGRVLADSSAGAAPERVPRRIVSLAPSVTESLFAVGLGPRVVGVTSYCRYPPEAQQVAEIGGYMTPSYEAIVALRPDLIVLLPEHDDVARHVAALGIEILRLDHRSVRGVLEGFIVMGERCGVRREAEALVSEMQGGLDRVERVLAGRPRPRVVLSLGGKADRSGFRSLHAAGPGGIHHDLVVRAGGVNLVPEGPVAYPVLSAEGLLRLDPDAIVELASGARDASSARDEWRGLGALRAVRNRRVLVFTEEFLAVPGPRLIRFIDDLSRALHPDAHWGQK